MHWGTRKGLRVDRVACVWLIRRYIDPDMTVEFVDPSDIQKRTEEGVLTFDAADSKYRHKEHPERGKYGEDCTFQVIMAEYGLDGKDPALDLMAKIIYSADVAHRLGDFSQREGFGLWALANGFASTTPDDEDKLRLELPMYDALYAYCQETVSG